MKSENIPLGIKDSYYSLFLLLISIIIIWALSGYCVYYFVSSWEHRGLLGDMFGTINSLFSGLAFGGLLYTIYLQRKDLKLYRAEIIGNQQEIKRTVEAQENAANSLKHQLLVMQKTIKIDALNSLIKSYTFLAEERKDHNQDEYYRIIKKRQEYIKLIEEYLISNN